jgi:hypothetical protein
MLTSEGRTTPFCSMGWEIMMAGGRRAGGEIARALLILALGYGAAAHAATLCDAGSYGAKADGTTKDTLALQRAIDDCAGKGGGTVRLARGTFLTGPIVLKSHITLQIDSGATLLGSQDRADYPGVREMREDAIQPLIGASNAFAAAAPSTARVSPGGQRFTPTKTLRTTLRPSVRGSFSSTTQNKFWSKELPSRIRPPGR